MLYEFLSIMGLMLVLFLICYPWGDDSDQYKKAFYKRVEEEHGVDYVVRNRETLKKDFERFADEVF